MPGTAEHEGMNGTKLVFIMVGGALALVLFWQAINQIS